MTEQTEQTKMTFGFNAMTAPDGSKWVSITHMMGAASFTWGVPVEQVNGFLREFADNVKQCALEAKRAISPQLITPGAGYHLPDFDEEGVREAVLRAAQVSD